MDRQASSAGKDTGVQSQGVVIAVLATSGELVLLLGASGSGKTTLLSALAAILRPAAGTIRVGEVEVTTLRGAALTQYRRHRVGIVFQTFNPGDLSGGSAAAGRHRPRPGP
jgi:ABC-type lipoprotein export system ATPase subunit